MLRERILILSDPFSAGEEEGSEIADGECVRLSLVFKVTTPVTPAEAHPGPTAQPFTALPFSQRAQRDREREIERERERDLQDLQDFNTLQLVILYRMNRAKLAME
jgi:hypothetical protein